MSILKKMIGLSRAQALDNQGVVRAWSHLHADVLQGFEVTVPQLRWRTLDILADPLPFATIASVRPDVGLYFGFGYTEKTTSVLVQVHDTFAQLMSQAAFGGSDGTQVFAVDETLQMSRFDVLLFSDIMQSFYRQLHETFLPQNPKPTHPTLKQLGEGLSPLPFELDDSETDWVKISLNFKAEMRPQEASEDSGEDSGDDSDEAAPAPTAVTPEPNWPDVLPVTLFLPQSLYAKSLLNRFVSASVETPLSVADGIVNWKARVENSRTPLRAVVENAQMTVADCTRLEIGQIIPLPGVSLQSVSLEAELAQSRVKIATGSLGIHKTRRALKITDGVDPDFIYGADMLNTKPGK